MMNTRKTKDFSLDDCLVRLARKTDRDDLIRIARGIWGGTDYLPKVMDRWIAEPWFLVCEYRGRVIACLKMSLFPDNVLWFEGLRVHVRYQNQGVATLLNRRAFAIAADQKRINPRIAFEFCTYYQNVESLHLTQKMGFQVVERFYTLNKRGIKATREPEFRDDFDLGPFHNLPGHVPCSWQAVHNLPDSLDFLRRHGRLLVTPNSTYYCGGLHDTDITLLEPPTASLREDLPYLQSVFGSRRQYAIILPEEFGSSLPWLHDLGFRFWEGETVANMLILRM